MGGPWFTVHKSNDDWQRLDQIWISNGQQDCRGHVEIKVDFDSTEAIPTKNARAIPVIETESGDAFQGS